MARPRRHKTLRHAPVMKGYKPFGVRYIDSEKVYILPEEYEVMKLIDYDGLTQEEAALMMKVSRPTITRIYQSYRKKISEAFVENKSILFETVNEYSTLVDEYYCENCKSFFDVPHNTEVNHCIHCGSENVKPIKSIDMKTINFEPGFGFGGGRGRGRGFGRGRDYGEGHGHHRHHDDDEHLHMGPTGYCICVKCGARYEHIPGTPCKERRCEKCGTALVREGSEHHRLILEKLKKKEQKDNNDE